MFRMRCKHHGRSLFLVAIVAAVVNLLAATYLLLSHLSLNRTIRINNYREEWNHSTSTSDTRPQFVLHVGPAKSGSTAFQSQLHSRETKDLLRRDNYSVIDHEMLHQRDLVTKNNSTGEFELPWNLTQTIFRQRKLHPNHHWIGSSEYLYSLPPGQCQAWKTLMSNTDLEFHAIVFYRRLHNVLPSLHNQRFKMFRIDSTGSVLRNYHPHWPGVHGDVKIPTFEGWFHRTVYGRGRGLHPAHTSYHTWNTCADKITLFNMHESTVIHATGGEGGEGTKVKKVEADLLTNFMCKVLNNANATCTALLQRSERSSNTTHIQIRRKLIKTKNKSVDLNYEMLAVHAYENGFLPTQGKDSKGSKESKKSKESKESKESIERPDVVRAIQEFVESRNLPLPMKCPTPKTLDFIYNLSLEGEKWALSVMKRQRLQQLVVKDDNDYNDYNDDNDYHDDHDDHEDEVELSPLSEEEMLDFNNDWQSLLESQKLCWVDARKAMKMNVWKDFFREAFGSHMESSKPSPP